MGIEVVVFDLDGVLAVAGDTRPMHERFGLEEGVWAAFHETVRRCAHGEADLREEFERVLPEWGWDGDLDAALALYAGSATRNAELWPVVERLAGDGVRCCVGSTQERYRSVALRRMLGLDGVMDSFLFSWELGATKGNPVFFERATVRLGVEPERVLFLDDVDGIVETARSVGWNAEVYAFGDDLVRLFGRYGVDVA